VTKTDPKVRGNPSGESPTSEGSPLRLYSVIGHTGASGKIDERDSVLTEGGASMPKKWCITVEPFPDYSEGRAYSMKVAKVSRSRSPKGMRVVLEHLEQDQLGRQHEAILPLPVRPSGQVADFMRATGTEVTANRELSPSDAEGAAIKVLFSKAADGWDIASFEPLAGKKDDDEHVRS